MLASLLLAVRFIGAHWKAAAILLSLLFSFYGGWKASSMACAATETARLEAEAAAREETLKKGNEASERLENELLKTRARARELNRRLEHEISNNITYRDCHLTPDGVQAYNSALSDSPQ